MKTLFKLIVLCPALMLASCAMETVDPIKKPTDAEVEQYNASVPPEERIMCRDETSVGSNIPKRICRLISDMEETSRFHRQELIRAIR